MPHHMLDHVPPPAPVDTTHTDLLTEIRDMLKPIAEHASLALAELRKAPDEPPPPTPDTTG